MNGPTTLILDGIWGRPRRFEPLRRQIEQSCGPAEIFRYDASGAIPIERLGMDLGSQVQRCNGPVNLVAFSMGGIVARTAMLMNPALNLHRAVFINSPHHGSLLAYALPLPAVRQLRPGSPLMRRLQSAEWNVPTMAVWCPGDLMVLPGWSARWDAAQRHIRCDVPLHPWPVWSKRLHREVVEFLREG